MVDLNPDATPLLTTSTEHTVFFTPDLLAMIADIDAELAHISVPEEPFNSDLDLDTPSNPPNLNGDARVHLSPDGTSNSSPPELDVNTKDTNVNCELGWPECSCKTKACKYDLHRSCGGKGKKTYGVAAAGGVEAESRQNDEGTNGDGKVRQG